MPELTIRSSDGTLETAQLSDRPLRLVRSESCDIVLRNVPDRADVRQMTVLLTKLGVKVSRDESGDMRW